MKFPNKIKIHHRDARDVVVKRNCVIRCIVDTAYVESSKNKSALLAKEVMKRWNMHDELLSFVKTMAFIYSSEKNYPEGTMGARYRNQAQELIKQAEQK